MFGIRILFYLVGIALVVWILFRLARAPEIKKSSPPKVDDMVRCARCGTFVPRGEAIRDGDRNYCCSQHRDEDR